MWNSFRLIFVSHSLWYAFPASSFSSPSKRREWKSERYVSVRFFREKNESFGVYIYWLLSRINHQFTKRLKFGRQQFDEQFYQSIVETLIKNNKNINQNNKKLFWACAAQWTGGIKRWGTQYISLCQFTLLSVSLTCCPICRHSSFNWENKLKQNKTNSSSNSKTESSSIPKQYGIRCTCVLYMFWTAGRRAPGQTVQHILNIAALLNLHRNDVI